MSQDKKLEDSPFVSASIGGCLTGESRPYKKYIIIAVTAIVALAIILTSILVGVHLSSTEAQKEIMEFSYNMDPETEEEVTSDMNTNLVQYHVMDKKYEMWIVNNFNRDIQVMKIQTEQGTECYLTPLDRTIATEPSKIRFPSGKNLTNTTYILNYLSANIPVSDSASMCEKGRSTCNGMSTYWLFPSCDDSDGDAGRQKRRSSRKFGKSSRFRKFRKIGVKVLRVADALTGHGIDIARLILENSAANRQQHNSETDASIM